MSARVKITVLGGGAWGCALAHIAAAAQNDVILWARDLGRMAVPQLENVSLTDDLKSAVQSAELVLLVVPAQQNRNVLLQLNGLLPRETPLVLCAKGIELETGLLLSGVVKDILPNQNLAVLSGPGFSADVLASKPTAVTIAVQNMQAASTLCATLSSPLFRCYASDDIDGVEASGALKNVYAIAAGAAYGANLGASAGAALITRSFTELQRLGKRLGGRAETFQGLSGMGDLILTCTSERSRNFSYGVALAREETDRFAALAEGAATAMIATKLVRKHDVDAPIIDATAALIEGKTTIDQAVAALMARPLRAETE